MAGHRLQRAFLVIAAIVSQGWIAECSDSDGVSCNSSDVRRASIGKEFTLHCSLGCTNDPYPYQWFNYTGQQALDLPDSGATLVVSEKVESAAAVGGQCYACRCRGETGPTKCYIVWVTPYVKFNVSKEVVKLGSSVTITCSAESYPPANCVDFFDLQHPVDEDIPHDNLTLVGTSVVYRVDNASRSDGGEYECVVLVNKTLQSESRTNLTVYDPPVITDTRSSAVVLYSASGGGSAVLECVVENRENNLKVWVNWTRSTENGFDLLMGGDYVVGSNDEGVHFLVVHNVTEDQVHPYTCQLYSIYSPNKPEDQRTINITAIDLRKNAETSGTNTQEDCSCLTTIIAASVTVGAVIIILIICNIVVVVVVGLCRKHKRKCDLRVDPRTGEGTVQNNYSELPDREPAVRDGREEKSPASVSPKHTGDQETGKDAPTIDQNDASIHRSLSTQSKDSATSVEEKGSGCETVEHNAANPQATESRDMKECHPVSPTKRSSLVWPDQPLSPRLIASALLGSGSGQGTTTKPLINYGESAEEDSDGT